MSRRLAITTIVLTSALFTATEVRAADTTFTVRVVDQFGAEIAGSTISVPGVGPVASGSDVTVPEGNITFGVIPKILDTAGFLSRAETRTVDPSTSVIDFVWPVEQVQLNLVDQFGAPIVGLAGQPSVFWIEAAPFSLISNGSTVALPITDESVLPGTLAGQWADGYDLRIFPAVHDTTPGRLSRLETSGTTEVTTSTSALTFEWPIEQVQLNLVDQFDAPIAGLVGQPSVFWIEAAPFSLISNGSTVALPITDESVLPGTLAGQWADGYDLRIFPAVHDTAPGRLSRLETSGTTEVTASTSALTFQWAVQEVQLNLVDQFDAPIAGLVGQPSVFWIEAAPFSLISNGSTVALPITDESVLPGTLAGQWADGYDLRIFPAVHDTTPGRLSRLETSGTTEVTTSTSALTFQWAVQEVQLNLVDQFDAPIAGLVGQPSVFWIEAAPFSLMSNGDTVKLPITDESVLPGTLAGQWADGYDLRIFPAVFDTAAGQLHRLETSGTTEVLTGTSDLTFEWIQFECALQVIDDVDLILPGSTLVLPSLGTVSAGTIVQFPITDEIVYPTIGGSFANGYPIIVIPGDIAPASDSFAFEMLVSGEFEPAFFEIDGNTYSLACTDPDTDGDGLTDTDELALGTDPNIPDTDGDGLLDGTEVDIAMGTGCPDPLDADSDGDTISDGDEVAAGTNPCNPDSDGDGVPDQIDPNPLDPGDPGSELEQVKRLLAEFIAGLDLSLFIGQNDNVKTGRRNSLATRVQNAANACSQENFAAATALLQTVLEQVDGQAPPADWMDDSPEKSSVAEDISFLIALLQQ